LPIFVQLGLALRDSEQLVPSVSAFEHVQKATVSFAMSVRYPHGIALPKSGFLGTLLAPDQRISGTMGGQHIRVSKHLTQDFAK